MANFQIKGAPTCRVVYPQGLFEKRKVKGAENSRPKYNAIILVPKDDKEKMAQMTEAFAAAFDELQKKGFKGKTPDAIDRKNCAWFDGDKFADAVDGKEAFRGYMMLKVSSPEFRPIVTDNHKPKRHILNGIALPGVDVENISDETLEDGDFIFATVSFWTYANATAAGIGANAVAVVRFKEGERIGGASQNVEDYVDTEGYE